MFTILPLFCLIMFGAISLANIKGVFKLTDCTLSQSSLLVESMFSKSAVPALLTKMSIVPKTSKALSATLFASFSRERSASITKHFLPKLSMIS